MLTQSELLTLYRSLRDQRVLSVYIDGTVADPAAQRTWRLHLERGLRDIRTWLADASHEEREEFERCVRTLEHDLEGFDPSVRAQGWVAFITADGAQFEQTIGVPVSTLAVWSSGPCVAPYVRVLSAERPIVLAVVDARRASIHQYRFGILDRLETVHAHHPLEHPTHMGGTPRQGFHVGTRGTSGRDQEQRALLEGRDRMLADAADRIIDLAGPDGWIVLGGIHRVSSQLDEILKHEAPNRVLEMRSLDVHSTEAQAAATAREGAAALRRTTEARRVAEIIERAGSHGLGVIGPNDTQRALDERRVHDLYLSPRCFDEDSVDTEAAVSAALDQHAVVEEVSGEAADALDKLGGIAAGLRFRTAREEPAADLETAASAV